MLICEDMLLKFIHTTSAATTLALAELHCCPGLKEGCLMFLRSPGTLKQVMECDVFEHLKCSCTNLVEELVAKISL